MFQLVKLCRSEQTWVYSLCMSVMPELGFLSFRLLHGDSKESWETSETGRQRVFIVYCSGNIGDLLRELFCFHHLSRASIIY